MARAAGPIAVRFDVAALVPVPYRGGFGAPRVAAPPRRCSGTSWIGQGRNRARTEGGARAADFRRTSVDFRRSSRCRHPSVTGSRRRSRSLAVLGARARRAVSTILVAIKALAARPLAIALDPLAAILPSVTFAGLPVADARRVLGVALVVPRRRASSVLLRIARMPVVRPPIVRPGRASTSDRRTSLRRSERRTSEPRTGFDAPRGVVRARTGFAVERARRASRPERCTWL